MIQVPLNHRAVLRQDSQVKSFIASGRPNLTMLQLPHRTSLCSQNQFVFLVEIWSKNKPASSNFSNWFFLFYLFSGSVLLIHTFFTYISVVGWENTPHIFDFLFLIFSYIYMDKYVVSPQNQSIFTKPVWLHSGSLV